MNLNNWSVSRAVAVASGQVCLCIFYGAVLVTGVKLAQTGAGRQHVSQMINTTDNKTFFSSRTS